MASSAKSSCGICFWTYDALVHIPKVLSCGHTYCTICLEGWRGENQLSCPERCDGSTDKPTANLPTNFEILRVIVSMCIDCSLQWTQACPFCSVNVCDGCHSLHQQRHGTDINESANGEPDRNPEVHKQEIDDLFDSVIEEANRLKNNLMQAVDEIIKQNIDSSETAGVEAESETTCNNDKHCSTLQKNMMGVYKDCQTSLVKELNQSSSKVSEVLSVSFESIHISNNSTHVASSTCPSNQSAETSFLRQPSVLWPDYSKATLALEVGSWGSGPDQFDCPWNLALLPSGNIVVTDTYNHRVQVLDRSLQLVSSYGCKGSDEGQFQNPDGVAVDSRGLIYVADKSNHRVQVIDEEGHLQYTFGSKGSGPGMFNEPLGIAIDQSSDQVYVCDSRNNRVQVLRSDGSYIKTLTDINERLWHKSQFVSVIRDGGVIVTDYSGNLHLYDSSGKYDVIIDKDKPHSFMWAAHVATDRWRNLLVVDSDGGRIVVLNEAGQVISTIGTKGEGPGQLDEPHGIVLTEEGHIILSDWTNCTVVKFYVPMEPICS